MLKRIILALLILAFLLTALTGCGPDKKEAAGGLTVRFVNDSGAAVSDLAVRYAVDGQTVGSRSCEKAAGEKPVFEFRLTAEELPAGSLELDVFAAEKPGADYAHCGHITLGRPEAGIVLTCVLTGDPGAGLTLAPVLN